MAKTPAWQRKEGKNPSGGLNAKGRASYNRATGGNLKAPSKKVGNKRRASFCARMKGMKKKLTSSKTNRFRRLHAKQTLKLNSAHFLHRIAPVKIYFRYFFESDIF